MNKKVVILGAGGNAKVIADIILKNGDVLVGFLDDNVTKGTTIIENYSVVGKIDDCLKIKEKNSNVLFIISIGNNYIREEISKKYDLNYYTAIHPNSCIGIQVKIGDGTVVMSNTCINPSSVIGKHCIINTGAIVEHDNNISDFVHVSPNATLCGTVNVGKSTHIGAGSVIKNNVYITDECIIGAGAVVVKDINNKGVYVGVPAKLLKKI